MATESVSSSGTFWARVTRTKKEEACFVDDMERMGLVLLYNYMYCTFQTTTYMYQSVIASGRKGKACLLQS